MGTSLAGEPGRRGRGERGSGLSENQRRAQDLLTARDLVLRGAAAVGLIVAALMLLLTVQPT